MKQVYYTISRASRGLGKADGFQVRAASPGLPPDRRGAVTAYAGYALPTQIMPSDEVVDRAPVRLALLDTPDAGRLLCHSVYAGHDPLNPARQGNYFSHLLLDLPADMDPRQALQSWGSKSWCRVDGGSGTELPETDAVPQGEILNDSELKNFLATETHRQTIAYVLAAILHSRRGGRIFLGAPPLTVAWCVYGAARALPRRLRGTLTFSTYERNPLQIAARIIGTCWGDTPVSPSTDLPETCYCHPHFGYNEYTGRKTEPVPMSPYVDFALEMLKGGRRQELDSFLGLCERLDVEAPEVLDLLARVEAGKFKMASNELDVVLRSPKVAAWFLDRPEVQQQVIEWTLEDTTFSAQHLRRLLGVIEPTAALRQNLADAVWQAGVTAIQRGELARARRTLEEICPLLTLKGKAVWRDVMRVVVHPEELKWEVRSYVLTKLGRDSSVAAEQRSDQLIERWLTVPEDALEALLQLDLPLEFKLTACRIVLCHGDKTDPRVVLALAKRPKLAVTLVEETLSQDRNEERAKRLIVDILGQASAPSEVIDELVGRERTISGPLLDACMQSALQSGRVDVLYLVQRHGRTLAQRLANGISLEQLVRRVFERVPATRQEERNVSEFVKWLTPISEHRPEIARYLKPREELSSFLQAPALDQATLARVARAVARSKKEQDRVFEKVCDALLIEARGIQMALETVLIELGQWWPTGPAGLYRGLLRDLQERPQFWNRLELVCAFLAIALGASVLPGSAKLDEELLEDGEALAEQAGQYLGARRFNQLAARSAGWPPKAQRRWNFLARYVRPVGLLGTLKRWLAIIVSLLAGFGIGVLVKMWGLL